jgi:predicted transcriptional regulator
MPRPPSRYPTELELEILKLIWRDGSLPAADVRDKLADEIGRDLAHTSVITTLNVMTDKGYLSRKRNGKSFLFRAKVRENTISRGMIGDLVDRVFDGSAAAMMLKLIESRNITSDELQEVEKLVSELKQKSKSKK